MKFRELTDQIRNSDIGRLYNLRDEMSKGRVLILGHNLLDYLINSLVTGIFYTSFLTMNGIDIVSAGILTFVPYIAQLITIVSPYILERMPKRRWFLATCRFLYYFLFIFGVTVMPELVVDRELRLICFVALVLAANVINSLGGQGYTVWHAQYLPDELRSNYFMFNSMVVTFGASVVAIVSALAADMLSGSAYESTIIIGLRYFAFALGVLDVIILLLLKEYPYPKTDKKQKLLDVFVMPLKCRKFMNTMLICFAYNFVQNLPTGVLSYYLLNTAKISYSLTYVISIVYTLFLMVFFPYWCRKLERSGWVRVFNIGNLLDIPALIAFAFVDAGNVVWLYTLLRMLQHFLGVGRNTAYSNFLYMNLPAEDQTNYVTFYALGVNVSVFLSISLGTWFVSLVGDGALVLFGHTFGAVPLLLLIQTAASALMALFTRIMEPAITPDS